MDTSSLVTTITGYVTNVGAIGLAVLGLVVAVRSIGWFKSSIK